MAFNKDLVMWIIESFITHKKSEITISSDMKKKFSDVAKYARENKIGKSLAGNTVKNTDNGYVFTYEYSFGANSKTYYILTVNHRGDNIISMNLTYKVEGAAFVAKDALKRMDKALPDFAGGPVEEIKVVDYSSKTLKELVDIFDKKLQEFSKKPDKSSLAELDNLKNTMSDKVNEKPIAERGPFGKPLSNMGMYIDALKSQFQMGLGNPTQFVSTYVPQISTSLSELAALL